MAVDTGKMTEEVMEGLDKFRYKGKEEESDSDNEIEAKAADPQSQDPFQQRELSPEPHKPASPDAFRQQESPEPPKTQQPFSGIPLDTEVVQEQPKYQDQLADFESRDPSADLLGGNFQPDQQQPQGKSFTLQLTDF